WRWDGSPRRSWPYLRRCGAPHRHFGYGLLQRDTDRGDGHHVHRPVVAETPPPPRALSPSPWNSNRPSPSFGLATTPLVGARVSRAPSSSPMASSTCCIVAMSFCSRPLGPKEITSLSESTATPRL